MFRPFLLLLNIQSLNSSKIDLLECDIAAFKVNFICLTETWLNDNDNSACLNEFQLGSSYNRHLYKGGGTAIFVKKGIVCESLDMSIFCVEKEFEICGIRTKINNKITVLLTCYRSPCSIFKNFMERLERTLSSLYVASENIILCGDFNVNMYGSSTLGDSKKLENMLKCFI